MYYVGVDLHKQVIVLCAVKKAGDRLEIAARRRMCCSDPAAIDKFFSELGPFQAAVEATAAYEWFLELIEKQAQRIVLVHPRKMRIIAESRRKTDRFDAQVLAEFLARDELPEAWRPTPRTREHRSLVRLRETIRRRISGLKCRLRNLLAHYNADRPDLFTAAGRAYLASVALNDADRFVAERLCLELDFQTAQRKAVDRRLAQFAEGAGVAEREAREVLATVPGVGPVTVDIVLSELGDIRRFRSAKKVVQYAGLAPGVRESSNQRRQLHITKEGSPLLRWAMLELAWRLVAKTSRWRTVYQQLKLRCGVKKAIVAVARRVLCMLSSMLRSGQAYRMTAEAMS